MVDPDDFNISIGCIDRDLSVADVWRNYERDRERFESEIDRKAGKPISTFRHHFKKARCHPFQNKAAFGLALAMVSFWEKDLGAESQHYTDPFKGTGGGGSSALAGLCKFLYEIDCTLEGHTPSDNEIHTESVDYDDLDNDYKRRHRETWGEHAPRDGFSNINYTKIQKEYLSIAKKRFKIIDQLRDILSVIRDTKGEPAEKLKELFDHVVTTIKEMRRGREPGLSLDGIKTLIKPLLLVCVGTGHSHPMRFSEFLNFVEYGDDLLEEPEFRKDSYGYRRYLKLFHTEPYIEPLRGVFGTDPLKPFDSDDDLNTLELEARETITSFHEMINPQESHDSWLVRFKVIQNMKVLRELLPYDGETYRQIISDIAGVSDLSTISIFDTESLSNQLIVYAEHVPDSVQSFLSRTGWEFMCNKDGRIYLDFNGKPNTEYSDVKMIWESGDALITMDDDGDIAIRDEYGETKAAVRLDGFKM